MATRWSRDWPLSDCDDEYIQPQPDDEILRETHSILECDIYNSSRDYFYANVSQKRIQESSSPYELLKATECAVESNQLNAYAQLNHDIWDEIFPPGKPFPAQSLTVSKSNQLTRMKS